MDRIKEALAFIGEPKTKRKMSNNVLLYTYNAEGDSVMQLRLKIEIIGDNRERLIERFSRPKDHEHSFVIRLYCTYEHRSDPTE